MATPKLPASAEYFKQLSLDTQQLKIAILLLETFVFQASDRGYELRDNRLLLILEQLEVFVLKTHQLLDNLEKRLCSVEL